jgi:hypothetical protein
MKPFPLNVRKFRYPDGRAMCQGCLDAVAELAAATGAAVHAHGRVDLDAGDPRTRALWRRIVSCKEAAAGTRFPAATAAAKAQPSTLRWLCPHRVTEWQAARGDARWEILNGLRAKLAARGWWIDLSDERVKAFLTEEGDAAKVLLSACP